MMNNKIVPAKPSAENICLEIKNALLKLPNSWSLDGFEFESVYE
jgi:hypothetical protein